MVYKSQNLCNMLLNMLYIYNSNLLWNVLIIFQMYTRLNNSIWKKLKVLTCKEKDLTWFLSNSNTSIKANGPWNSIKECLETLCWYNLFWNLHKFWLHARNESQIKRMYQSLKILRLWFFLYQLNTLLKLWS